MRYLAVKRFFEFQHYTDRNPPWIKLHYKLIGDLDFKRLTEVQQIHLVLIWLIASRLDNKILYDEAYIRAAIGAKRKVDLKALIAAGFLIEVEEGASADLPAAPGASTNDSPGASTGNTAPYAREEEAEVTENYTPPSLSSARKSDAETELARRLPTDADRIALTVVVLAVGKHAKAWLAEMSVMLDGGMPGHLSATPTQLGEALRDFVANGAHENKSMRQFRRYVQSAIEASKPKLVPSVRTKAGPRAGAALSAGEQMFANIVGPRGGK